MPTIEARVECPVHDSFKVQQVSGMFDLPPAKRSEAVFKTEVPDLKDEWRIGCIVGPSGSGKSTIAQKAFGDHLYRPARWPKDKAVIDCFGDRPVREVVHMLTAVGFSSPPAWLKPHHVLSNGEKFRCELARALMGGRELVVFDEFTSVVDRTVARIGSAAIAKAIRGDHNGTCQRLVAVTCHYDVLEWIEPDWVVDMATCQLARGCLRRPEVRIEVVRCTREAWPLFRRHHYLSGNLGTAAICYLGLWDRVPVAFAATMIALGRRSYRRVSRVVVSPDYQGIGIGGRFLNAVAAIDAERNDSKMSITTSHPAMIGHLKRDANWQCVNVLKTGSSPTGMNKGRCRTSTGRAVVTFAFKR